MEKHTLFISDERKLELFKKHYVKNLGGDIDCKVEVINGVSMNIVTFPSDLPSNILLQYVWTIGVSTGLDLCRSIINGTTSPISPLDKAGEEPEKTL